MLNVHNIIRDEDGFKLMLFSKRDCNTKYTNIWFTTKFKLENSFVHLHFCDIFSFFIEQSFSIYAQEKRSR